MDLLPLVSMTAAAYLAGSVPFGIFFARLFSDVDVRSVGSGNIGATNVLRASGKGAAALTLLADGFKGALPVLIARWWLRDDVATALAGIAAVTGHAFPVFLGFRGGKSVATGFGVMLAAAPLLGLACLLIWLFAALLWRYSSLAALLAYLAFPLLVLWRFPHSRPLGATALFLAGMIYIRHRENIKRLIAGTEPKIGEKK